MFDHGTFNSIFSSKISRSVLLFFAALLFIWALFSAQFRDAEGFLTGIFCFPLALSIGLLVLGFSLDKKWKSTAGWFVLLMTGQAASLQLIQAGNQIGYQHYHIENSFHLVLVVFLFLQTIIVIRGLGRFWRLIWNWIRTNFRVWQIILIGFIFAISGTALSRNISQYIIELIFAAFIQLLNLAIVILAVKALPPHILQNIKVKFEQWFDLPPKNGRRGIDRFAIICSLWVFLLALGFNIFSYERHPHIPDEVVYLYHAKYLSEGHLTLKSPPIHDAFDVNLMYFDDADGRWFSPVPPGWPAFLALGSFIGLPFLINPLLGGINILLIYILLQEISSKPVARISTLLLSASPWFIFMAMNYMTHTFTLTIALIAAIAAIRMRKFGSKKWALISGVAIGGVSLIRPLEGLAVAIFLGIFTLTIKPWSKKILLTSLLAISTLIAAGTVLPYNKYLTGKSTKFPIMEYTDKYYGPGSNSLGFGPEKGLGWMGLDPFPGHGLRDVAVNTTLNFNLINIELFGWSIGSLLIILLVLFSKYKHRIDFWMLGFILIIVGLHSLYWFNGGPDFGARYWFLIIVPCVFLTVRGIQILAEMIGSSYNRTLSLTYILVGVLLLSGSTLINFIPWRAIDKYHHYRGMRPGIRNLEAKYDFKNSLVFIRGKRHPDYMSSFIYNPTDFSKNSGDQPLYVWDKNPEIREEVLAYYPNRKIWTVDGPSITQRDFQIAKKPSANSGVSE